MFRHVCHKVVVTEKVSKILCNILSVIERYLFSQRSLSLSFVPRIKDNLTNR